MMRELLVNKSRLLLHTDVFKERVLKKSIVNIKLVKRLAKLYNTCKNKANYFWLHHEVKHAMEVDAKMLTKSICNDLSFVALD